MEKDKQEGLLSMDIKSIPKLMDIDIFMILFKDHNLIFWDSCLGGKAPELIRDFKENKLIVDVSTEEGKQILKDINTKIN